MMLALASFTPCSGAGPGWPPPEPLLEMQVPVLACVHSQLRAGRTSSTRWRLTRNFRQDSPRREPPRSFGYADFTTAVRPIANARRRGISTGNSSHFADPAKSWTTFPDAAAGHRTLAAGETGPRIPYESFWSQVHVWPDRLSHRLFLGGYQLRGRHRLLHMPQDFPYWGHHWRVVSWRAIFPAPGAERTLNHRRPDNGARR
jgi:hypothetical protein